MELEQNTIEFIGKPKICCIDIGGEDIELIRKRGANVATGTLGAKIEIPEFLSDTERSVLPNHKLPDNLHEFDIIIIDLNKFETIVYNGNDHIKKQHTGRTSVSFLTGYPETLFDPRPFGSLCLAGMIKNVTNRDFLVLVFGCESYEVEYEINVVTNEPYRNDNTINKTGIYSFWHKVPIKETIFGTEISVTGATELHALLQKHVKDAEYHQTFNHPIDWHQGGNAIPSEKYTPLLINLNGDIVSYFQKDGHRNLILLPQLKSQSAFIIEFLEKVGPSLYPQLFPFSTSFNWKEQPDYWLPRHTDLIKQRELIVQDFEKKISDNEKSIENNSRKYSFLHHIIYQTGGQLTIALIEYFKWLEFEKVDHYDNMKGANTLFEEDIQITLPDGILVIECKGIGGTSTDSDCGQISKIKHRRCKERGKFDVYALYIVNHQRYLPPLNRQNPPFLDHQIQDAINDERGLLTTWQLFNLYFDVDNSIITKEEARKSILSFGLVNFRPDNLTFIYSPTELFKDGTVCIVDIDNVEIKVNEDLLIEKNGRFEVAKVLKIKKDDLSVGQADKGQLGLQLNIRIPKHSKLWKRMY